MSKSNLESTRKWNENNPERYIINRNNSAKKYRERNRKKISERVKEIRNFDVCNEIRKHSKDMEEDTEAFSSDFMINFIFGKEELTLEEKS